MHFFIPFWMFHATSVILILESIHRAKLVIFLLSMFGIDF